MSSRERATFTVGDDGVGRITLIWSERRNAIDPRMVEELAIAVNEAGSALPRALLLQAEGPAFTVGGDMRHFSSRTDDVAGALEEMIPPYHSQVLLPLAELPMPIVAAVDGAVAGGGLGLIWPADHIVASARSVFATGFAKLGLSGDGGSTWWLPRLVGDRRAREMIVGGRIVDGQTALDWGLVSELAEPDDVLARAEERARAFAAGPPVAYAAMRSALLASSTRSLADGLDAETAAMRRCGESDDSSAGISAFAEGREPSFEGS